MANSDQFAKVRWEEPPTHLALESDRVHLWRTWLDQPAECVQSLTWALDADERFRSGRFRLARDRERFIVRRGLLRTILGRYCGIEPDEVRICYGLYGKPALAQSDMAGDLSEGLCFNSTHSQGVALYAIAFERQVGVDVEAIRPIAGQAMVMRQFFSDDEAARLDVVPAHRKDEMFLNCWTFKEAHLKARGQGLDETLTKRINLFEPDSSLGLKSDKSVQWSARTCTPAEGYTATVVVEGQECKCRFWDFALVQQRYTSLVHLDT